MIMGFLENAVGFSLLIIVVLMIIFPIPPKE